MEFIPVNEPLLDGNEKKYLTECIDTGWISSEGPFVNQFEEQLAKFVQRKHAIAVCNGSVALDTAVLALGIGNGDEVIMPTFTIISCAAAIVRAGAIPVVIDCEPDSWNMDPSLIERHITIRTKAILVVHIYGLPTNMAPVILLAKKYNLRIIEDAAEMHGQTYNGKPCGSFGEISTFSFYPNKHITTGEGGMIVTDDDVIAERCRSLRNLCFIPGGKRFVHEELGFNFRMTNLQAALGIAQLERIETFVQKKRRMGAIYNNGFMEIKEIETQPPQNSFAENIYWVYGIVLKEQVAFDADIAMQKLAQLKIGTRPFFWCMHEQPVFKKMGFFRDTKCPVAERISRRGFYVPSGLALSESQMVHVIEGVKKILAL